MDDDGTDVMYDGYADVMLGSYEDQKLVDGCVKGNNSKKDERGDDRVGKTKDSGMGPKRRGGRFGEGMWG